MGKIKKLKENKKKERKKIMGNVDEKKEEILKNLLDDDKGKQAREAIKKNEEDWTTSAQEDMLDWIEEQGIYIRQ